MALIRYGLSIFYRTACRILSGESIRLSFDSLFLRAIDSKKHEISQKLLSKRFVPALDRVDGSAFYGLDSGSRSTGRHRQRV